MQHIYYASVNVSFVSDFELDEATQEKAARDAIRDVVEEDDFSVEVYDHEEMGDEGEK